MHCASPCEVSDKKEDRNENRTAHDTVFRKRWKLGIIPMLVLLLKCGRVQTRYTVKDWARGAGPLASPWRQ